MLISWLFVLVRSVGASFPGSASLVQFHAEIESREIQARLRTLEDPLSALHPDIRPLSEVLYDSLRTTGESRFHLDDALYTQYRRALHILDAQNMIAVQHVIGRVFPDEFWINDAGFILYMCALFEDPDKMDALAARIDQAAPGRWLHGVDIAHDLGLPRPVVKAILQLYEARGLGILSKEVGALNYYVRA